MRTQIIQARILLRFLLLCLLRRRRSIPHRETTIFIATFWLWLALVLNGFAELSVNWMAQFSGDPEGLDVTADGNEIILTSEGSLYSFDSKGWQTWKVNLGRQIVNLDQNHGVYCLRSGLICALAGTSSKAEGKMFALDESGKMLWSYGSTVSAFTASEKKGVIVGIDVDGIFCLGMDGRVKWRKSAIIGDDVEPTFVSDYVILSDSTFTLFALNYTDGSEAWKKDSNEGFGPQISEGSSDTVIVPLDRSISRYTGDGKLIWKYTLGNGNFVASLTKPSVMEQGNIIIGRWNKVLKLSVDGKLLWSTELPGNIQVPITVDATGTSYVVAGGRLVTISASGKTTEQVLPKFKINRSVLINENGNLLVLGDDHRLYSFSVGLK